MGSQVHPMSPMRTTERQEHGVQSWRAHFMDHILVGTHQCNLESEMTVTTSNSGPDGKLELTFNSKIIWKIPKCLEFKQDSK